MIKQEHIDHAIHRALRGKSNLTDDVLAIRGFSNGNIRRLINNLTDRNCTYLEVGVLMGGTFVSSFNKDCVSIGFEDFCQDFKADIPNYTKEELQQNIEKNVGKSKQVDMRYECGMDCNKATLPYGIDIYLFDGEHGIQNQSIALPEMFDNMAHQFVYLVDDASWPQVADGTGVGFKFLRHKVEILKTWELRNPVDEKGDEIPIWVCGVNIYLCRKK